MAVQDVGFTYVVRNISVGIDGMGRNRLRRNHLTHSHRSTGIGRLILAFIALNDGWQVHF